MARQTPSEKMSEIRELRTLGYYRELEGAKLDAKAATSKIRAELVWADKLESAKALLSMDESDVSTLLKAESILAKASGKGEMEGKIEAAGEAGLLESSEPSKGNGKAKRKAIASPKIVDVAV